jgi:hypothetical protein
MEFQDLMRDRFEAVIEAATGRDVIGFMSGNQQSPDMMCEVFILAPTDLHRRQRGGRPARASGLTLPGPGSVARARARRPRASPGLCRADECCWCSRDQVCIVNGQRA